jgi:Bacterial Ig-like domain/Divergent InlB B-repeat domain
MRQFLTRPWGMVAVAMLATVAAVAVGYVVASEARANHVQSVLTVVKSPTEGGTVTGYGIDCGTDCTESFEHSVTCEYDLGFENCWDHFGGSLLRAAAAPGYAFAGWTDCPGEQYGECHASLPGEDLSVTARFRRAECSDGYDNDFDQQVDSADSECVSSSDDSETLGPVPLDDLTPPPLTVTPASFGVTRDTTPTVEFSSTEAGVTYNCWTTALRPDSGIWYFKEIKDDCTSPYTTPPLEDGNWRIEVSAMNAAGRAVTEVRRPLSVDTTAPDTSVTLGPSGTARSTNVSLQFSSSESGPTFECRLDDGAWSACTSPKDYSSLSQGSHTFGVAATDAAGNRDATPATRSWNVDSIAPTVAEFSPFPAGTIGVSPTADVLASFSEAMQASTISGTTVKLTRNGTTTPVTATVTPSDNGAKLDPHSSLKGGATYTAIVTTGVEDLAGNPLATSKTWSFTVTR